MNKTEVLTQVSKQSGVNLEDCRKVLDAFEEVLNAELANSKHIGNAFDKVYSLFTFLKGKKG